MTYLDFKSNNRVIKLSMSVCTTKNIIVYLFIREIKDSNNSDMEQVPYLILTKYLVTTNINNYV